MKAQATRPVDGIVISDEASVREAIERIDSGGVGLALLVAADGALRATLSDGDVRRAMLRGIPLESDAYAIANHSPTTARAGAMPDELVALFRARGLRQIPLLDGARRPVALWVAEDTTGARRGEAVVIMAGGRGTRLGMLTEQTPKPMVEVGGRPILEILLEQLGSDGFGDVILAVNYLGDRIRSHFRDGSRFGLRIDYVAEREPLGTAGALRLAAERLRSTFVVLNGDLLTTMRFGRMIDQHRARGSAITMAVTDVELPVRFGLVDTQDDRVLGLREKPAVSLRANAGIYVVEPEMLRLLPPGRSDMPELVDAALREGQAVGCYVIRDLWLDVGELTDLQRARAVYQTLWPQKPE